MRDRSRSCAGPLPALARSCANVLSCRMYGETRTRTGDTTIFSRVLYQLSYLAAAGEDNAVGAAARIASGRPSVVSRKFARPQLHTNFRITTLARPRPRRATRAAGRSARRRARASRPARSRSAGGSRRAAPTRGQIRETPADPMTRLFPYRVSARERWASVFLDGAAIQVRNGTRLAIARPELLRAASLASPPTRSGRCILRREITTTGHRRASMAPPPTARPPPRRATSARLQPALAGAVRREILDEDGRDPRREEAGPARYDSGRELSAEKAGKQTGALPP